MTSSSGITPSGSISVFTQVPGLSNHSNARIASRTWLIPVSRVTYPGLSPLPIGSVEWLIMFLKYSFLAFSRITWKARTLNPSKRSIGPPIRFRVYTLSSPGLTSPSRPDPVLYRRPGDRTPALGLNALFKAPSIDLVTITSGVYPASPSKFLSLPRMKSSRLNLLNIGTSTPSMVVRCPFRPGSINISTAQIISGYRSANSL